MGLSRNKVAVSEGAAGSPPFYGESDLNQQRLGMRSYSDIVPAERAGRWIKGQRGNLREALQAKRVLKDLVVQLSVIGRRETYRSLKQLKQTLKWGCSSAGRAPALQAGGQGFEPLHLHQPEDPANRWTDQSL